MNASVLVAGALFGAIGGATGSALWGALISAAFAGALVTGGMIADRLANPPE